MTFEDKIARLRELTRTMESGSLPLEAYLQHFEESASLLQEARSELENATLRVEAADALLNNEEDGIEEIGDSENQE